MWKSLCTLLLTAAMASAQSDAWYAKAVKSVEASFEPATAKPGQTVTFKLTIDLHEGYHTYPTMQKDKNADGQVNKIAFPEGGPLIFVGNVKEPKNPDVKAEPLLGIKALHTYHGIVVYERTAVVSPKATAGEVRVALKALRLSVCDESSCYGPKTLTPATKLTITGDPVPVEKAWAAEVEKALAGK